jgi:hypothetical protein
VGERGGDGLIDGLQDGFFDLGGDPRRHRPARPQPDFPRTTAGSMSWALTAARANPRVVKRKMSG